MDRQKVVNRSLGNLLRSLIGKKPRRWEQILPRAEFAYNSSRIISTDMSLFRGLVYGSKPTDVYLQLVPI